MDQRLHLKLVSALTDYDRRESKKKWYNPWALGQCFAALERAESEGGDIREALERNFSGRLLDKVLKALN